MTLLIHARTMSAYNRWMNDRLYALCADLSDEQRKRDLGAFFKSIHGTLNHLLLADRIWLGRFTGQPFHAGALDQELYADFDDLYRERRSTDESIAGWVAALKLDDFDKELSYMTIVNPQSRQTPLWLAVAHFFNHQTHHRGQLTTLMMQSGIDPGVTDLMWMPPEATS